MLSLALFIEDPLTHNVRSSFERKKKKNNKNMVSVSCN